MNTRLVQFLSALVLIMVSVVGNAAQVSATLTGGDFHLIGPGAAMNITDNATWMYDTVTGVVTGTGDVSFEIPSPIPVAPINFTHDISDLSAGGALTAGATEFTCLEGGFAALFTGSACPNYAWGDNEFSESTFSYGPGLAFSRSINGDDVIVADQHSLAFWDGMTSTLIGSTLTLTNADAIDSQYVPNFTLTFQVVPIPAAAWLFASALGVLGWLKRRTV